MHVSRVSVYLPPPPFYSQTDRSKLIVLFQFMLKHTKKCQLPDLVLFYFC